MNIDRLYEILDATTQMFRKGEVIEDEKVTAPVLVETPEGEPVGVGEHTVMDVRHIYAMPHESAVGERDDVEMVDCHFITIGVLKPAAEEHREELIEVLRSYPQPDRLAGGPSYIEVGGEIGSQDGAFRLFALGQALGLWHVITPERLGLTGQEARRAAGAGYVLMSGWRDEE
jgi:hypothetical protein